MTHRFSVALVVLVAACSGSSTKRGATGDCFYGDCRKATPTPAPAQPAAGPRPVGGAVGDKAQALREAADLLEKAEAARASGNRNLADQLFSTAELITGPEALAAIAGPFREGAPPRITTPTQKVDPSAPRQPRVVGSSEAEDEADKVPPPPRAEVGSLTGTLKIDGKAAPGTYGLITLEPASGKWKPRTPKHVVIEQRNREFLPKLVAVSVGSTIAFPNFDPTFHNVFSTSPLAPFDLGLYKLGEQREYTFAKEGFVRLGCNLHANMQAFIAVVAAPAYVVTDDEGKFVFKRLAPGKYKLRAWSMRSTQPITQDITIKAGKNSLDVGVTGDAPSGPAPDKFGGKRG